MKGEPQKSAVFTLEGFETAKAREEFDVFVNRLHGYINLRWFYLIVLGAAGLIGQHLVYGADEGSLRNGALVFAALACNWIFSWLALRPNRSLTYYRRLGGTLIALDVIIATGFIFGNGGIESRTLIIYSIPIIMSGALFDRRAIYRTALLTTILYDAVVLLDYHGLVSIFHVNAPALHDDAGYLTTTILFYSGALMIIGALSAYLKGILGDRETIAVDRAMELSDAQKTAQLGNWQWDIPKDHFTGSDTLYELFGINPQIFRQTIRAFLDRVALTDRKKARELFMEASKSAAPFDLDHEVILGKSDRRFVNTRGRVLMSEAGVPTLVVGTSQDITRRYLAEQELKEKSEELQKLLKAR